MVSKICSECKRKILGKNDALNRIGDCFYITKDYKAAIEYYDKAAMLGLDKIVIRYTKVL